MGRLLGTIVALATLLACSDGDEYAGERRDCVDHINELRASIGLPELERWREMEYCADGEARMDHMFDRAHGAFGNCEERAQNECPGWNGMDQTIPGCLDSMWSEGPGDEFNEHGHYINMTNPDYTKVACGFHVTDDGKVWAVQNFQ